jgi:aspartyl-tRNA(Asn)/glutamyl-tRNA(Gln) amidotransferase subunit A
MSFENITRLEIREVLKGYRERALTPCEVVEAEVSLIEADKDRINSFLCVNENAVDETDRVCSDFRKADPLPLAGIPLAVKDLLLTRGMPTTGGSRAPLPITQPSREAWAVTRLKQAGAILVGKNNLHEFAFGITNENEHFGACLNPWQTDRMTGGSSGGSAAAVAAGMCLGALGTDTRGSIRIPASLCGVSGLKPTLGRVSTRGVLPLSGTLDHVGPIARTVRDLETIQLAISRSFRSVPEESFFENSAERLRIGVCDYYFRNIHEDVEQAVKKAIGLFEEGGARVEAMTLPILEEALHASDIISRAEAVAVHDYGLQTHPESYGPLVRGRLETGYEVSGIELVKAYRTRERVVDEFRQAFKNFDCLMAPAVPVTAPTLGTHSVKVGSAEESIVQCFVRLNAPQNVAGIPALVIPCGFDPQGLPIGLQLIGWRNRDAFLLELGKRFQDWTSWHLTEPGRR